MKVAEKESLGLRVTDAFGNIVSGLVDEKPEEAARLLRAAFRLKRFQTRHLPEAQQLPSARIGARVALEAVTNALDRPQEAVLTSVFLPAEPFLAMGLRPLVAEALADFISAAHAEDVLVRTAEETGVPETYCSYHKVLLGAAAARVLAAPRFIANCSVACDANNTTFRRIATDLGSAHVYVDVPYTYDEDACAYVAEQLQEMTHECEEAFGRTLDEQSLREHVARSQQTLDAMVRTLPMRRGKHLANDMGLEMQEALALHPSLGSADTLRMAQTMLEDFPRASAHKGLSLVWMHSAPFFSRPLQELLDQNQRAQIIASDMCFNQASFDGWSCVGGVWKRDESVAAWEHGADEPWLALAERLIKNSFNGPAMRRVERVRTMAQMTGADGVVCFCHWGCKETMGASQLTKRELEAAGIPVLTLDGDGCHRANDTEGQAATRMGAFLEMLEGRRGEDANGR